MALVSGKWVLSIDGRVVARVPAPTWKVRATQVMAEGDLPMGAATCYLPVAGWSFGGHGPQPSMTFHRERLEHQVTPTGGAPPGRREQWVTTGTGVNPLHRAGAYAYNFLPRAGARSGVRHAAILPRWAYGTDEDRARSRAIEDALAPASAPRASSLKTPSFYAAVNAAENDWIA